VAGTDIPLPSSDAKGIDMANAYLPPDLARFLATHHDVATTRDLRRFGVGRTAQQRLIDAAVLQCPVRGVFVLATAHQTLEHRCRLLSCSHPDGFVTGPTAGKLANLRRQPIAPLHYSTRHGRRLDPVPGVHFRQTTIVRPGDRIVWPDGIVVASPARLAFDVAADLRQLDHESVVQQLRERGDVTDDELLTIGERLCHPARRGSSTFRRTLEEVIGTRPSASHPEVEVASALRDRGVPIELQMPFGRRADGRPLHLDLGVPAARWGVELDLHPEHRTKEGAFNDAVRRRAAHACGIQVETVTDLDLLDVPMLADQLTAAYRRRVAELGTRGVGDRPGRPPGLRRASGLG